MQGITSESLNKFYEIILNHPAIERSELLRNLNLKTSDADRIMNNDPTDLCYLLRVKNIPFEFWDKVARICDDETKAMIVKKYPLLDSTYEYLLRCNEEVRVSLCSNKKLPDYAKDKLRNDKSKFVMEMMKKTRG